MPFQVGYGSRLTYCHEQYKEKGDESGLHIIIFDELDAIFKQRGSTNGGTGVGDTVVNQILSKVGIHPISSTVSDAHEN